MLKKQLFIISTLIIVLISISSLDYSKESVFNNTQIENFSKDEEYIKLFSKIMTRHEQYFDNFVANTNRSYIYHIISYISPSISQKFDLNKKSEKLLLENINNPIFLDKDRWFNNSDVFQSVLDNLDLMSIKNIPIPDTYKEYDWENFINNYELSDIESYKKSTIIYIYKRILNRTGLIDYDVDNLQKNILGSDIKNKSRVYGYFLTHIIFYDSDWFQKELEYKDYQNIIKEIENLTDFVIKTNDYDLAGELYICLKLFELNENDSLKKLDDFLFSEKAINNISVSFSNHLLVVYLLSLVFKIG